MRAPKLYNLFDMIYKKYGNRDVEFRLVTQDGGDPVTVFFSEKDISFYIKKVLIRVSPMEKVQRLSEKKHKYNESLKLD